MGEIPLFDKCSPYANAATIFRAKWRRLGACVRLIAISRRNRCCSRRRAYSSAPSRLVQPAAGPRATCWPHGASQAARNNRAKSRAMSASPPASASSMCRGSDATQRRRSAPSMESGGSARNLKRGRRAGGNRNRDALAWDDLRSIGNGYPSLPTPGKTGAILSVQLNEHVHRRSPRSISEGRKHCTDTTYYLGAVGRRRCGTLLARRQFARHDRTAFAGEKPTSGRALIP